jgi:hypothetical protein
MKRKSPCLLASVNFRKVNRSKKNYLTKLNQHFTKMIKTEVKTKVDSNTVFHIQACKKKLKIQYWLLDSSIQNSEYLAGLFQLI